MKVLLDADLLVLACLHRSQWEEMRTFFALIESREIEGYLLENGLEKYHSITRILYGTETANKNCLDLISDLKLNVLMNDKKLFEMAKEINSVDFESDLEIVYAIQKDIGAICTLCPENFSKANISILSLNEALNRRNLESSVRLVLPEKIEIQQWLNNNFEGTTSLGWREPQDFLFLIPTRHPHQRAKRINLGNEYYVILLISIFPKVNNDLDILFEVRDVNDQSLPKNLKLIIIPFDESKYQHEEEYQVQHDEGYQVQPKTRKTGQDSGMRQKLTGSPNDKFILHVALNEYSVTEVFVL